MPFGPVFVTSDIGGGRPYTRLKGPLLIGYSTADPGGQTLESSGGGGSGSASRPAYSFYNRPDAGLYGNIVTSSAADIRFALAGLDLVSWSSTRVATVSTDLTVGFVWANGFLSSANNNGAIYIPQTTYAVSSSGGTSSGATPTAFGSGAALIFDSLRNKLSVFSTVANQWLSVTLSSS